VVAGSNPCHAFSDREHLDSKFMPQYTGEDEEGLPAIEGVQIGATHPDAVHLH
jgi:hypothetical protein